MRRRLRRLLRGLGGGGLGARGVLEGALGAAAPRVLAGVQSFAAEDDVAEMLEAHAEVELIADVVAGRLRALLVDGEARPVHREPLVQRFPRLEGDAAEPLLGDGEGAPRVRRDAGRGEGELALVRLGNLGRGLGGSQGLLPLGDPRRDLDELAAHLVLLRVRRVEHVLPDVRLFVRRGGGEFGAESAPAPAEVRGGGARGVAHDVLPPPLPVLPHLHELAGAAAAHEPELGVEPVGGAKALVRAVDVDGEGLKPNLLRLLRHRVQPSLGVLRRERTLHERRDVGEVPVVVDDELDVHARLVPAVGDEIRILLEPALVKVGRHRVPVPRAGRRPVGDGVRGVARALGGVPLVEHRGDDDEGGGPAGRIVVGSRRLPRRRAGSARGFGGGL